MAIPMLNLAREALCPFSHLPGVKAIVIAGSVAAGTADEHSDIDAYIYSDQELPLAERHRIALGQAETMFLDNRFWELGDEWIHRDSGVEIDITYRTPRWIEDDLERVLTRHEGWTGYSTCFWHNLLHSVALYDPSGWYADLQRKAQAQYPVELQQAIIAKNWPILTHILSAYSVQLRSAVRRGDAVSVNHRIAAYLASYFDILFAVNQLPHPGEKRMIQYARTCQLLPFELEEDVTRLLESAAPSRNREVDECVIRLTGRLNDLLRTQGLLPTT